MVSKYLHSKSGQEPVLEAVLCKLHDAIREPHQTSAHSASVAVVAQRHLVVDPLAYQDCRNLWSSLLAIVASSLSLPPSLPPSPLPLSLSLSLSQAPKAPQQSQERLSPPLCLQLLWQLHRSRVLLVPKGAVVKTGSGFLGLPGDQAQPQTQPGAGGEGKSLTKSASILPPLRIRPHHLLTSPKRGGGGGGG